MRIILNSNSPAIMSLQPFQFLDLPPEIRQKIYILICTSPLPHIPLDKVNAHAHFPYNLLLTNSQIYHEVRPIYFSINAFQVDVQRDNSYWAYFICPAFQDNRRQVRSLVVTLFRWGSKNFFQDTLIPLLEDLILNGRLRLLEFQVSMRWFDSQTMGTPALGEYIMEGGPLDTMRRILSDPYLESGILRARDLSGMSLDCSTDTTSFVTEDVTAKLFEVEERYNLNLT